MLTCLSICTLAEASDCLCVLLMEETWWQMTRSSPSLPRLWPGSVILVSMVRNRQRPTQFDWLILSSRLLPSMLSSASVSLSHYQHEWKVTGHLRHSCWRICPPLSIFLIVQLVLAAYHQPWFVYSDDSNVPVYTGKKRNLCLKKSWDNTFETKLWTRMWTHSYFFYLVNLLIWKGPRLFVLGTITP